MPFYKKLTKNFDFGEAGSHNESVCKAVLKIFESLEELYKNNYLKADKKSKAKDNKAPTIVRSVPQIKKAILEMLARRLIVIATNDNSFAKNVSEILRNAKGSNITAIVHINSSCNVIVKELYNLQNF